jgi:hypothetical protein
MRAFQAKIDSSVFRSEVRTHEEFAADVVRALGEWERRSFRGTTLAARDFYAPLLRPDRIAGHLEPLLGRDEVLNALDAFVRSDQRVFLLVAPWGQGKSRILLEWAGRTMRVGPIRFVREGINPGREDLEISGSDPCVLLLEDVQRRSPALPGLMEFLTRSSPAVKLVVTTRPSGEDSLDRALRIHGLEAGERSRFLLPPLAEADHRAILKAILGNDESAYRIFQRTRGNVLAGVLAARLVQRGKTTIAAIESSPDFSLSVLGTFKDSILDEASGNPEVRRALERLLSAVAVAAPIDPANEDHCKALADFLEETEVRIASDLQVLEDGGLLIRGGRLVTLAVDGVADLLLEGACIRSGRPTGYAEKAFRAFWPVFGGNALRNLGAVQWKLGQGGIEVRLLDQVWPELEALYESLPATGRIGFLDALREAAPFDPKRALDFIRRAIDYGLGPPEEVERYRGFYTIERIYDRMAKVISSVLYDPSLVGQACDLLWKMASADSRDLEGNQESADRVIREAGDYSPHHSLPYLEAFVKWAEDRKPGSSSPIPGARLARYLKPLLGKETIHTWFDGRQMTMSSSGVRYEVVRRVRQRALDLLTEIASGRNWVDAGEAIPALGEALAPSVGFFGREVSQEEQAQWEDEQINAIARLRQLVRRLDDRGVDLLIIHELQWVAAHAPATAIRSRAGRLRARLWKVVEGSIELAVAPDFVLGIDPSGAIEREHREETSAVAIRLVHEHRSAAELSAELKDVFMKLDALKLQPNPVPLLNEVSMRDIELGVGLAEAIAPDTGNPLAGGLHGVLGGVLKVDPARGRAALDRALRTKGMLALRSIAIGLRDPEWAATLGENDVIASLRALTNHENHHVRVGALWAVGFAGHLPDAGRSAIMLDYDLATAPETGEAWAEALMPGVKIYAHLSPQEKAHLAHKLRDIGKLGHWSVDLMAKLSQDAPEELMDAILYRLTKPREPDEDLDAVPSIGQGNPFHSLPKPTRKRGMIELGTLLQGDDVLVAYNARRLFSLLAQGDPELVNEVRSSWVSSNDPRLIVQAAKSFREEEPEALFTHQEFTVNLIRAAARVGGETYYEVRGTLIGVTHNGLRRSMPGEPPPRDIEIRDRARGVAAGLAENSPEHEMYTQIAESMDDWIRRMAEEERDRRLGT